MLRRPFVSAVIFFGIIMLLYAAAVFSTFKPRTTSLEYVDLFAFALTVIGGLTAFALGYASVIMLGGKASLMLVDFMSRMGKSKQIIEVKVLQSKGNILVRDS